MFLFSIIGNVDFLTECFIVTKASKYLSEWNNINNKKILYELFNSSEIENKDKNSENNSSGNNNENKFSKYRIIVIDNNNSENYFDNNNNKFQEVEMILNIEYNNVGTQTEQSLNNIDKKFNKYIDLSVDDDLSNNLFCVQNKFIINNQ